MTAIATLLRRPGPILALAPMQDVTDLAFWRLLSRHGGADLYFTEYFRVHATSTPEKAILKSIAGNTTGRPVVAQMIGNDIAALVRTARALERHPIAGIDFNLGCPAPVVYRKCAGGGLLRDLDRVEAILGALREAVALPLSVKTRIGFDAADRFDALLEVLARHELDLVTVHGRTVAEMYRSEVHYDCIARAVAALRCPVLANGNISSAAKAAAVLAQTGARGVMIGRGAIRNPWIFLQIRAAQRGEPPFVPTGHDVLDYVRSLFETLADPDFSERAHVQRIKKFMNYLGLGIDPAGRFLHEIRRVTVAEDFHRVCSAFLDHGQPMPLEPFALPLAATDVLAGAHG